MSFLGFNLNSSKKPDKESVLANGKPSGPTNRNSTTDDPSFKDLADSPMGRKLNLAHLSEEECEKVLQVIQRDFELRNAEKERLGKIEEEIKDEDSKTTILAKQKHFNENCCMRCFSRFIFIFNQKVECKFCEYFICKNCADWDKNLKEYVCHVCQKQRELSNQSCEWFYNNVKKKFKRFGSAKVVRSLYKRKSESDSENDSGFDPSQYSNSMPIGNRKSRASIEGFFDSIDKHINAKGGSDDRGLSDEERTRNVSVPLYKTPYTCTVLTENQDGSFAEFQERELSRFTQHLNCVVDDIHRTLDDNSPQHGEANNHTDSQVDYERLLDNHRLNISTSLSNLIQGLHIAVDNQDVNDSTIPPSKHNYVKQLLVKEIEQYTGAPVDLEETTSEYGTEDGSVSDVVSQHSPRLYEDILSDSIIRKILQDRMVSNQARKDELEEQRLRKNLTKLSNHCTVNQLSGMLSSESGTETDDPFSPMSSYDIIDIDSEGIQRTSSPLRVENEYDIISDYDDDVITVKGKVTRKDTNNAQNVKNARDRLQITDDDGASGSPAFYGRSDSSDTLMNDSDSDSSDLDELVRRNTFEKSSSHNKLNLRNNNNISSELISRTSAGKEHAQRIGSDSSADRTLRNSNYSENDITITLTSPDDVTEEVFSADLQNAPKDENKNVIERLNLNSLDNTDGLVTNGNVVEVNRVEIQETSAINDELRELKNVESPRQKTVARVTEDSGSDDEVHEDLITRSQIVHDESAPVFIEDEEEDIESALAFAQKRREQMILPDFQFDDNGSLLSTGDVDLDDISRHGDDSDEVMSTMTIESEITFGSHWDLNSSGRGSSLFGEKSFISPYDNFGDKKVGKDIEGPVFMFVPKSEEPQSPRVGERTLDDLSDLSENDSSGTEIEDLISSSDEEEPEDIMSDYIHQLEGRIDNTEIQMVHGERRKSRSKSRRKQSVTTDSCVQTDPSDLELVTSESKAEEADVQVEYMTADVSAVTSDGKDVEPLSAEALEKRVQEEFLRRLADQNSDDEPDTEDKDPRFYRKPQHVSVPEGEMVRVVCETGGTQPLDVFWYKEEAKDIEQIDESDRVDINFSNGQHSLEIYNTTKEDEGQYMCIAVNEKGQAHKAFAIKIEDNSSAEKKAPEYLKGLQDQEVVEGNEVSFRCKLSGYPQPRVIWYKDGKKLKNCEHHKIEKIGNRDYVLTIAKASLEDDAEYSVTAKNVSGEAKSRAQLLVEHAPEVAATTAESEADSAISGDSSRENVYPDTDSLLKIAERVHAARTSVTSTAENMLGSADHLSTIHSHLDEMDKKLNNLEEEVHESMTASQADSLFSEDGSSIHSETHSLREAILKEHEEMRSATKNVRSVTSSALEVLVSAEDVIQSEHSAFSVPEPSTNRSEREMDEYIIPKPERTSEEISDEEEELHLSFSAFERLYKDGYITREQIRTGRVRKRDLETIKAVLAADNWSGSKSETSEDEEEMLVNCGLKRIDSKRYKRDYVVNRSPQVPRKHWEVSTNRRQVAGDVVKATPAGERERILLDEAEDQDSFVKIKFPSDVPKTVPEESEPQNEVQPVLKPQSDNAEDEIYMTASKVYTLEERITHLEGTVQDQALDDEEEADKSLAILEEEVARAAAKVAQSEKQVDKIEESVYQLNKQLPRSDDESEIKSMSSSSLYLSSHSAADDVFTSDSQEALATPSKRLRGQSSEEDIPASRSEFSEEEVEMPSVRSLMSKFNSSLGDEESSLKRVHSLTGRDLPKTVRDKLKQSAPPVQNSNVRIQDLSAQKKRPGFLSMLDDSYLQQQETPLDPAMQKSKYKDAFDRVMTSTTASTSPHGPRSSTPRKAEEVDMSFNVSSVRHGSPYSTRTDESSYAENRSHDGKQQTKNISTVNYGSKLQDSGRSWGETSSSQDIVKGSTAAPGWNPSSNRSSGVKSKSTSNEPSDEPPKRNKKSAIMARAAFWDRRVDQGIASDKEVGSEFPDLPTDTFKSDEEF